jgi:hypothetical protein
VCALHAPANGRSIRLRRSSGAPRSGNEVVFVGLPEPGGHLLHAPGRGPLVANRRRLRSLPGTAGWWRVNGPHRRPSTKRRKKPSPDQAERGAGLGPLGGLIGSLGAAQPITPALRWGGRRASAAWNERRPSLPRGPPLHNKGPRGPGRAERRIGYLGGLLEALARPRALRRGGRRAAERGEADATLPASSADRFALGPRLFAGTRREQPVASPQLVGPRRKTRSPAKQQRDQEVDQAYKSATEKIPDRNNAKVDPWHDMRGTSASRNSQTKR